MSDKRIWLATIALSLLTPVANAEDLMDIYRLALDNDPQLRAAAAQRRSTGEFKRQAFANFLPNLTGSANMTRGETDRSIGGFDIDIPNTDTENYRLELRQTIYDGANYAQYDQSKAQVSGADADYEAAFDSLMLRSAERYFAVLTAEDALKFAIAEEKANARQLEQAEQRYEVGLTAITDVHEARASYDRARANVIVAQNALDDSKEALSELTGSRVESIDRLKEDYPLVAPEPNDSEYWVQTAVATNPALRSRQFAVTAAEEGIRRERSGHYPTVDAVLSYNDFTDNKFPLTADLGEVITTTDLMNTQTQIQLQLQMPIYAGGATQSRVRQAVADYDRALDLMEQERRAVIRQTRNNFRAVIAGMSEVQAFGQTVVSAQSALEATEAGFEVGTRTIVDVLIAQRSLFQAQQDYSRARHDFILDHFRLRSSAGTIELADIQRINAVLE